LRLGREKGRRVFEDSEAGLLKGGEEEWMQ